MELSIALIGDQNKTVVAHRAIPIALTMAAKHLQIAIVPQWIPTANVEQINLADFHGFWCVPASPYINMQGALTAIRYARENAVPFLGTCGGYQHAALEFVRNVLGFEEADNAEVNRSASMPLISSLRCKLIEESEPIIVKSETRLAEIYNSTSAQEDYHCSYGINRDYLNLFEKSAMSISAIDEDGEPKALEIAEHPFFVGTAFQPERKALRGEIHPIVMAFVSAVEFYYRLKYQTLLENSV